MKYAIVDYFGFGMSPAERMSAVKRAGFDGVMLWWAGDFDPDYKEFPDYARRAGLYVENAHAPFESADLIWEDSLGGQTYTDRLLTCIDECADRGVPTLVVHPDRHNRPTDLTIGIDRLRRLADRAEQREVNIAIENMRNPAILEPIFHSITSPRVGFCYDIGHNNAWSKDLSLPDKHGDRLMALHLHDNDGVNDSHTLPFAGSVDWQAFAVSMKKIGYTGAVSLEVHNPGEITDPDEFLSIAMERARAIGEMLK